MTVFSLAAYGLSVLFAAPVLGFFAPQDSHVFELVLANFGYFALSLLLLCPNMFAAYLFTAMGDGKRAAIVSFCRTFCSPSWQSNACHSRSEKSVCGLPYRLPSFSR